MRALRWLPSAVLLLGWTLGPVRPSIDARVRDLAGPSTFRLLDWETEHLSRDLPSLWSGLFGSGQPDEADADAELVRSYFAQPLEARANQRSTVEPALDRVIARAYRTAGLGQDPPLALPSGNLFPPVLVSLTSPPNVLVIAPRTALRVQSSTVLDALSEAEQQQLEASAESTGEVAALVAPIGGLATYPSMVLDERVPERVLVGVAHEWLHQYLVFYPLGQGYFADQQTREINETSADLVSQEIGQALAAQLGLSTPPAAPAQSPPESQPFDFRAFMRATRARTEDLLARGEVDAAEAFMRDRRDDLQRHGYAIRKLNQAYFALYGSYADGFAASPSTPIPELLRQVRGRSSSLGDFVARIRGVRTLADLERVAAS